MHLLGASGSGKSRLLESLARQCILAMDGEPKGLILIDPHGTLINAILKWVAAYGLDRYRTIRVLDPASDAIFGLDPLRHRPGVDTAFVANTFANVVTSVCGDEEAKPQLAEALRAIFYSLACLGWSLLEAELLTDIADPLGIRQFIIENVPHPQMRRFWSDLDALPAAKIEEKLGAAVRRLVAFLLPLALRRIFSQPDRSIDFRAAMDAREIILIDLSYGNGRISEDESALLGRMIVADIFLSALGRPEGAPQVLLLIDECQKYLSRDVAAILDQARKFGLSLILAHQHLGHLREAGEAVFRSVMTNAETKVVFRRLDDDDATLMARNLCRGNFDFSKDRARFRRPTVIGQAYDWLQSESTSEGSSRGVGRTESTSVSETLSRSETQSWTIGASETDTEGLSDSYSEAYGSSDSHLDSASSSTSESTSRSQGGSRSRDFSYGYDEDGNDSGRSVDIGWSWSNTRGTNTGTSSGRGSADGHSSSRSTSSGRTTSSAHSTSETYSETHGITEGTSRGMERSRGTTVTDTRSSTQSAGRSQTLRSIYRALPTVPFSLTELVHLASVSLAHLQVGEAVVAIGNRPPVRVKTLFVKDGWASVGQVMRLRERLARAAPFITPLTVARANYLKRRRRVMAQLTRPRLPAQVAEPKLIIDQERSRTPALKDEGWG